MGRWPRQRPRASSVRVRRGSADGGGSTTSRVRAAPASSAARPRQSGPHLCRHQDGRSEARWMRTTTLGHAPLRSPCRGGPHCVAHRRGSRRPGRGGDGAPSEPHPKSDRHVAGAGGGDGMGSQAATMAEWGAGGEGGRWRGTAVVAEPALGRKIKLQLVLTNDMQRNVGEPGREKNQTGEGKGVALAKRVGRWPGY
jgi:hypothetical protein